MPQDKNLKALAAALSKPDTRPEIEKWRSARHEIAAVSWNTLSTTMERHASMDSLRDTVLVRLATEDIRLAANSNSSSFQAHAFLLQLRPIVVRLARESNNDAEVLRVKLVHLANHVKGWSNNPNSERPPFSQGKLFRF